jgi:NADH-quinone oxidoreductase subunit F
MTLTEARLIEKTDGPPWDIDAYVKVGGYEAWKKCVKGLTPDQVVQELKTSGLRGRGGAGFPTGVKWDKVLNHRVKERYFVCNAGEHEPGTFKDRYLLKTIPHQLIEGCLIASRTAQAKASFIYVNHEYHEERENLKKALAQAKERGLVGKNILGSGIDIDLQVFEGHGSYVAGEETAMLESMQGRPAMPRQKPPFYPTDYGLYGKPTLVNNVETLCNIPRILHKGAAWFTQVGTEKCPGTMMFSLSGAVNRPGVYEMPMGVTVRELIEQCGGGVPGGRTIKAVFPGGPSFSMLTADQLDLPMDFDSLKKAGTGLGWRDCRRRCHLHGQTDVEVFELFQRRELWAMSTVPNGHDQSSHSDDQNRSRRGHSKGFGQLVTALWLRQRNGILYAGDGSIGARAEQREAVPSRV